MIKKLPDDVPYSRSKDMFKVALTGWTITFKEEKNFRFDCFFAFVVICLGFYFGVAPWEWCLLFLAVGLVLMAEAFNTAIENIVDLVCPNYHLQAKKIKDISSGAVLLACFTAVIIGIMIFGSYVF